MGLIFVSPGTFQFCYFLWVGGLGGLTSRLLGIGSSGLLGVWASQLLLGFLGEAWLPLWCMKLLRAFLLQNKAEEVFFLGR